MVLSAGFIGRAFVMGFFRNDAAYPFQLGARIIDSFVRLVFQLAQCFDIKREKCS